MMVRRVWVALALVLGVLDLRLASAEIPGLNKTGLLSVLARDWSGAGLDDKANDRGDIALSNGNAPSYLFKPGDFTYDACLPVAGRPSRCPVDMLSLVLINEPPEDERYTDGKRFNMTLRLHGDIYVSSPNSEGYFGMPKSGCSYERNHTTSVLFNLTTGRVDFTIQETVSDKIVCDMLSGKTMIQRCVGTCHPSLKGKVVTGMFDLTPAGGPTGADDPPAADFKLRMTLAIPYKVAALKERERETERERGRERER
ncbi:hypothetical protein T484DRAFT_2523457 [Baffinella frigidus]|nr:hypothetical protein T484DRAFT_2523457 [Cryptophyta sp. CCMP2293]